MIDLLSFLIFFCLFCYSFHFLHFVSCQENTLNPLIEIDFKNYSKENIQIHHHCKMKLQQSHGKQKKKK